MDENAQKQVENLEKQIRSMDQQNSRWKEQAKQDGRIDSKISGILTSGCLGLVKNNAFVFDLKPLHGIILGNPMLDSDTRLASTATGHTITSAFQDHIEIHAIDTCGRVIPTKVT